MSIGAAKDNDIIFANNIIYIATFKIPTSFSQKIDKRKSVLTSTAEDTLACTFPGRVARESNRRLVLASGFI